MSHFVGLCFGNSWEYDLENYYEGLEVEEYVVYTREEALAKARKYHEQAYNYALEALKKESLTEEQIKTYNDTINAGPSLSNEKAWENVLKWGYSIDENNNLLSTYNPMSKWDWYSIGGRWDGFLSLKERDAEGKPKTANKAYANEIDWDWMLENKYPPFCFVDQTGDWHEKGEMGWWGVSFNDQPENEWRQEYEDYIKQLDPDCLVTVIDFHI